MVPQWGIRRRRKRGGVLLCAVREAGIPPAVRARILAETSSAKRSKRAMRRLRLRGSERLKPFTSLSNAELRMQNDRVFIPMRSGLRFCVLTE